MTRGVSGTKEWAASNENVSNGCPHGCLYCYAHANARRFNRVPRGGWTAMEDKPGKAKGYGKRRGRIMFPTTHDIIPGENSGLCLAALEKMLGAGNEVLIVSKPHPEAIGFLVEHLEPWRNQVLFRFTIGSAKDEVLAFWEPGAPLFPARLDALLGIAYNSGFATSVSMEPLLEVDEDRVVNLVRLLSFTVTDSIWIGKANRLEERLKRNGHWGAWRAGLAIRDAARDLMASQSNERILSLYERLKTSGKVKWKESIKKVVGIEIPTEAGLDI